MNYEKLSAIADRSARAVKTLILEMEEDIGEAVNVAAEDAQESGSESIKINLSHTITLDLAKNKQEDKLAFSVKHQSTVKGEIPDPNQPDLSGLAGFDDVTVTPGGE